MPDSPLPELRAAAAARDDAERALAEAVQAARLAGNSWTAIGAAIGLPLQAVRAKYEQKPGRQRAPMVRSVVVVRDAPSAEPPAPAEKLPPAPPKPDDEQAAIDRARSRMVGSIAVRTSVAAPDPEDEPLALADEDESETAPEDELMQAAEPAMADEAQDDDSDSAEEAEPPQTPTRWEPAPGSAIKRMPTRHYRP